MRIVLPPSETKIPGGADGLRLEWESLALPELAGTRRSIAADLAELCGDEQRAAKVLGLGPKGLDQIRDNLELETSPVMPAIERYTGVVFDALDYGSLDSHSRVFADRSVWLFSALFGPIRATDFIPRYRLSFDSCIPSVSVKDRWLAHRDDIWEGAFTLDLRSEGYRSLAPLSEGAGVYLKIVKDLSGGAAVGHANKATKGRLARALIESRADFTTASQCLDWLGSNGYRAAESLSESGVIVLAVES